MKRSEMVRRLVEDLLTMDGFLNYSYGGHEMPTSYTEIAEQVIDYLVKQGMRAPYDDSQDYETDTGEWEKE